MSREDNDVFDGFKAIVDGIIPGSKSIDDFPPEIDEEEEDDDSKSKPSDKEEDEDEIDNEKHVSDDEEEENDDSKSESSKKGDNEEEEEEDDEDSKLFEQNVSLYLKERLLEEGLGVELADDVEINSVDDIINFLAEVVEESSKPEYASDEIKALDDYVKNGGSIKEFFKEIYSTEIEEEIDVNNIDLEDESVQERLVRTRLKLQGYSSDSIDKKIKRYRSAEVLDEEAEDSVDYIKKYEKTKKETLLKQQEKYNEETQKKQQEFIENVKESIEGLREIDDIPVTKKEKNELLKYIFEIGEDNMTKFQKDAQKDPINSLIRSAYYTKNKTIPRGIKRKAESEAYKNIMSKIKSSGKPKKGGSGKTNRDDKEDVFAAMSKYIR